MNAYNPPTVFIDRKKARKDGTTPIYLRVIIARKKREFNLKIPIAPEHFDDKTGTIRSTHRDASDLNLLIANEEAKCTEIFKRARLSNRILTLDSFTSEYLNFDSRDNFYALTEKHISDKVKRDVICEESGNQHRYMLNKMKAMKATCQVDELTPELVVQFSGYLKKIGNNDTTRAKNLTYLKSYVRLALKDQPHIEDPFAKFILPASKRRLVYLSGEELKMLVAYQRHETTPPVHAMALRIFLFMCFTGLRIGDAMEIHSDKIFSGVLVLVPKKTQKKRKMISIPLGDQARRYMNEEAGLLLPSLSEQYCNRVYKKIAAKLNISKALTHHVARHSFATNFLENGGHLEVLQDLMGHSDIKTTMVYSHVVAERKKAQIISVFSDF